MKSTFEDTHTETNLRGRRLKGKGKGVLGVRETRGPERIHTYVHTHHTYKYWK